MVYYGGTIPIYITQASWRNYRAISLAADYVLDNNPTAEWPNGRQGFCMWQAWQAARSASMTGVLWMDLDVVADPDDLAALAAAVGQAPGDVHAAGYKCWPQSTSRPDWIWSNRGGTLGAPAASQDEPAPVTYFSIGFTWTPARLLDLAFPTGQTWQWPEAEVRLSELALVNRIAAHAVPGCRPKHLHFQPEHEVST